MHSKPVSGGCFQVSFNKFWQLQTKKIFKKLGCYGIRWWTIEGKTMTIKLEQLP